MKADLTEPSGLPVEAGDGEAPMVIGHSCAFSTEVDVGLILYGVLGFGFNCSKSSEEVKLLSLGCLPGCPVKT